MAERRMFAKTIIDSDAFIDMPLSTQALYFHLSMRADDDGFINNPKKIQRMIGASDDDLKMLIAKRFIIPFDSGIVVIKHWKIHNYIRGDRKKETVYPEEMALLTEKENGAYTLRVEEPLLLESPENETPRQKAYRESNLPYSFEYKIRQAFYGEICPVCKNEMRCYIDESGIAIDIHKPSIQHNKPISKGGKHELGNISVICHHCNITLQDTETGRLNADEVIKKWDEICMSGKCPSSDRQVTDKCQRRLGKDSLSKDSVVEDNNTPPALPSDSASTIVSEEFEWLWSQYPRKEGKKAAFASYQRTKKKGVIFDDVRAGLLNYLDYIKAKKIEHQYIKQGSTWFNGEHWNDEYDYSVSESSPSQQTSSNPFLDLMINGDET